MKTYGEFFRDETGAVTIDWVALTAGILLLGIMVVYAIFNGGVAGLVVSINDTLAGVTTDVNLGIAMGCGAVENCGGDGGPIVLSGGDLLPVGSVVLMSIGSTDDYVETMFELPDGSTMITTDFTMGLPPGTVVTSSDSLTLPSFDESGVGGELSGQTVSLEFAMNPQFDDNGGVLLSPA